VTVFTLPMRKNPPMPSRGKLNLEKVKASLSTPCPHCGHAIAPSELRRVDFEQVRCPPCKQAFTPGKSKG
jgi:predicted RNA-binding Zn-ribbon protein involved in translation (DUF1610 family)